MNIESKISKIISNAGMRCHYQDIQVILSRMGFKKKFRVITVAGTNGKGTTVAMLEHVLLFNNKKIISHTSPHLKSFNERISINGIEISNTELLELLQRVEEYTYDYNLSYYQVGFLSCCLLSQKTSIDYLILEVGLGGRLDPANTIDPDISAITNIAFDHCDVLGNTLDKIGLEKVAICRKDKPLFLGSKMPFSVITYANTVGSEIIFKNNLLGGDNKYFNSSYNVAIAISEYLKDNYLIYNIPCIEKVRPDARMKLIDIDDKNSYILVDVAHNEAATKNLMDYLNINFVSKGFNIKGYFNLLSSKDLDSILAISTKLIKEWHIIDLSDLDNRFMDVNTIKTKLADFDIKDVCCIDDISDISLDSDNTVNVIFGSFVLAGEFLKYYEKNYK